MASLDQSIIDMAFLDGVMEWLKANPDYQLTIDQIHISVWKRNQKNAPDKIANFKNANDLIVWIRAHYA